MVPSEPLGGAMALLAPPGSALDARAVSNTTQACVTNVKNVPFFNVRKVGNIFIFFLLELAILPN